jgi:acetokinase family protein
MDPGNSIVPSRDSASMPSILKVQGLQYWYYISVKCWSTHPTPHCQTQQLPPFDALVFGMTQYTLAVNAGSSSLKCRLFQNAGQVERGGLKEIAVIKVTGLNSENVEFSFRPERKNELKPDNISSHEQAFSYILQQLNLNSHTSDIRKPADFAIAHRVVHGGAFEHPVVINKDTYHELENLESLAPL